MNEKVLLRLASVHISKIMDAEYKNIVSNTPEIIVMIIIIVIAIIIINYYEHI